MSRRCSLRAWHARKRTSVSQLLIEPIDGLLERGVGRCEGERAPEVLERGLETTPASMNLSELSSRCQIVRRALQYELELAPGFIRPAKLTQGAAEYHADRKIARVTREGAAAAFYSFFVVAGAPVFIRQLRKNKRRWVRLDPAPKFENATTVRRHANLSS